MFHFRPEKEAPVGVYICSSNHANQKLTRGSTTSWNTQLSEKDSQRSSGLYRVINKAWLCFNLLVSTYLLNVYCLMALKRPKWVGAADGSIIYNQIIVIT